MIIQQLGLGEKQAPRTPDESFTILVIGKEECIKERRMSSGLNCIESKDLVRQMAQRLRPKMLFSFLHWTLVFVGHAA